MLQLSMCSPLFLLLLLVNCSNVNSLSSPKSDAVQHRSLDSLNSVERSSIVRVRFNVEVNTTAIENQVFRALVSRMKHIQSISEDATITFLTDVKPEMPKIVEVYFFIVDSHGTVVETDDIIGEGDTSLKVILEDLIRKTFAKALKIKQGPEEWDAPVPLLLLSTGLGVLLVTLGVLGMWIFRMFDPKKPVTTLELRF